MRHLEFDFGAGAGFILYLFIKAAAWSNKLLLPPVALAPTELTAPRLFPPVAIALKLLLTLLAALPGPGRDQLVLAADALPLGLPPPPTLLTLGRP